MPTPPTRAQVITYIGADNAWTDVEIDAALAAEIAAQGMRVKFPADPAPPASPLPYPADLAEALKRRVHRHLVLKALPLGLHSSMSEMAVATTRVGADPEIQRLEAPWRKLVMG